MSHVDNVSLRHTSPDLLFLFAFKCQTRHSTSLGICLGKIMEKD